MDLTLLCRHGRSLFNVAGIVNGDPARDRGLDESGIAGGKALGLQLAATAIDLCVVSRFPRAQQTAQLALQGRPVETIVDPDLDDIRIGDLDGKTLAEYHAWREGRSREDPFPGGESLNDAARRYADAFERVAARPEAIVLVVCHEIPLRYAINAAAGSAELDGPVHDVPNSTPYLFDPAGLARTVSTIRALAPAPEH